MIGRSLNMSFSNGWLLIKCHSFMRICFKLGTDGSTPLPKYTNQLQLTGLYIISGCEGPAEKLSSFVDKLL